jgi:hypothetical protein
MARPLFLSYTWTDRDPDEVDLLDAALRLRGVPVWRDRRSMSFGTYNETRVREGIEGLCSGFALYYTEHVLASEFVLKIELPAMDARRRRGAPPNFFAGAVQRRSGSFTEAAEELRITSNGISLGETLGGIIADEDFDADLREAANQILAAYLRAELDDEVVTVRVETRGELPNSDPALLHLCWCPPLDHDPDLHADEVWERQLLPALVDLQNGLEAVDAPRRLRLTGNLHLSAALALGWQFRQPTKWSLEIDHQFVPCETALVAPNPHGWRIHAEPGPTGADDRLLVCLHATQDVANAMRKHCRELPPARAALHIYPPSGRPEKTSVLPEQANELAAAIVAEITRCRGEYGTTSTHLYLACPWPLATLLGWHLSSSGRLVMHEADVERSSYRAACELA